MAPSIVDQRRAAIEAHDIHMATCRYRRQGLICSTCAEHVASCDRLLSGPFVRTVDVA